MTQVSQQVYTIAPIRLMSDIEETNFSWVPIHLEAARKLLQFRDRSSDLVELLHSMHHEELKAMPIMDKDAAGNEFPLEKIDPFTFLANFNRGVTCTNRRALWDFLKREWKLESPLPESFPGIPVANLQNSWLMPYLPKRDEDHIPLLWEFFEHILDASPETLDTELMDRCLGKQKVGMAFLTMGMLWARPDVWVAADEKNVEFAKLKGLGDKPGSASAYRDWCEAVLEATDCDILSFSREAHIWALEERGLKSEKAGLAAPFDVIFEDEEQAFQAFDIFQKVILYLQDGETQKGIQLNTTIPRTRHINLNYVKWPVLSCGYPESGQWQVIFSQDRFKELLGVLPEADHIEFQNSPFAHCYLTAGQLTSNAVWEIYLGALDDLRAFFENKKSPYNRFHNRFLYEAIMDPESRSRILSEGLPSQTGRDKSSDSSRPLWVIAPGEGGGLWSEWFESGTASVGWNDIGDLTGLEDIDAFREAVSGSYPDAGPAKVGRMLHDFALGMEPGDLIVAKEGTRAVLGWGVVSSDYRYDPKNNPFHNVRDVSWQRDERVELPESVRLPNKTLTGYRDVTANRVLLDTLEAIYDFSGEAEKTAVEASEYSRDDALRDLFVAPEVLDRMMALLRRKKNLILQGAPGTGKTFIARRLAYLLMGVRDENRAPMIQFHQSTSYEDFIQGFRPDDEGRFLLHNGVFYDFCRSASQMPEEPHVFVIDEINRGNLSKIFGELMLLIEPDKRGEDHGIRLAYGDSDSDPFHVPSNVYLIGTMNTADRSLSFVDYALRRRFAFVEMEPGFQSPVFSVALERRGVSTRLVNQIRSVMGSLNQMIEEDATNLGRGYRIGHSFFTPTRNISDSDAWFREILEFEIRPLIEEYWADDPKGLEKALGILGL